MQRADRLQIIVDAMTLVNALTEYSRTRPKDLTPIIAARPIVLSQGLFGRLQDVAEEIRREPYLAGELPVLAYYHRRPGRNAVEWWLYPADDSEADVVVELPFPDREAAERYATDHGMRLAPSLEEGAGG